MAGSGGATVIQQSWAPCRSTAPGQSEEAAAHGIVMQLSEQPEGCEMVLLAHRYLLLRHARFRLVHFRYNFPIDPTDEQMPSERPNSADDSVILTTQAAAGHMQGNLGLVHQPYCGRGIEHTSTARVPGQFHLVALHGELPMLPTRQPTTKLRWQVYMSRSKTLHWLV